MAEKIKDNSYRCPWCGNCISKVNRYSLFASEKICPFCNHHYRYKDGGKVPIFTLFVLILLIIFFNAKSYIIAPVSILIEGICLRLNLVIDPMIRCKDTVMPTKGYNAEINLFQKQLKAQLGNDKVIPIVFIDDNGKPVSSLCCVRIENGKWSRRTLECDLKLLTFGDQPQNITDKIYLYNKGKIIASGNIICELDSSY